MPKLLAVSICVLGCSLIAHGQTESPPDRNRPARIVHEDIGSPTATVYTYSRWPLLDALVEVNREYGWAVDEEDAPVVNASEIVDDYPEIRKKDPTIFGKMLDIKGEPFHSTFDEDHAQQADVEAVLEQLVQDYNASGNPGKYKLERTASGTYDIVADRYKSQSGEEVAYTPILDCVISVTIPLVDETEAMRRVAEQVNKTCAAGVLNADFAWVPMSQPPEVYGNYDAMPARDVIRALLAQVPVLQYYNVRYIPGVNEFFLGLWAAEKRNGCFPDGSPKRDTLLNSAADLSGWPSDWPRQ
jgi:hypothetical protein